ncbi:hypothetical protein ISN44_As07g029230, partial [Arabidopsis suecica]
MHGRTRRASKPGGTGNRLMSQKTNVTALASSGVAFFIIQ